MSIDELKKDRLEVLGRLHGAAIDLRCRLSGFGFILWFGRAEYMLSLSLSDECGVLFPLTDENYEVLMAMPDDELRTYCLNWGKS
ncbi:MAG: hypothetical protein L0G41_02570 [Psychrobacter sp.]|nr:hypothetical protein [Psychrobacter sp.]